MSGADPFDPAPESIEFDPAPESIEVPRARDRLDPLQAEDGPGAAPTPWRPVSRRLVLHRRLLLALPELLALAAGVVGVILLPSPWWAAGLLVWVGACAWLWVLPARQVGALGYAERADDLLVRKGIMFRTLVVVPYGRMQYVDVSAGPLERRLGIATVQLHTASAGTDAAIPGLPPQEAARLRDTLSTRGEARLAGL